jgi:hypothetical protein
VIRLYDSDPDVKRLDGDIVLGARLAWQNGRKWPDRPV